jgi:hypothetical protein
MSDNVPEVFVMMRYPAIVGDLSEDELDQIFIAIRSKPIMIDKKCTFGALMTTCDGNSSPVYSPRLKSFVLSRVAKYEERNSTHSHQPHSAAGSPSSSLSTSSSSSSISGFYCKSAPAYAG